MGTGIIIDERGYIITNYHVVEGVKRIRVTWPTDPPWSPNWSPTIRKTDLAIIKIPERRLPGDSRWHCPTT